MSFIFTWLFVSFFCELREIFWAHLCFCTVGSYASLCVCLVVRLWLDQNSDCTNSHWTKFQMLWNTQYETYSKVEDFEASPRRLDSVCNGMVSIANCKCGVKSINHVTGRCALFDVKLHFYSPILSSGTLPPKEKATGGTIYSLH